MAKLCWKKKAFKALSFGKGPSTAGRNFSGSITIFHRGGGAKRLLRRIDFERKNVAWGVVERIEYDPNRTARIALVRWSNIQLNNCKRHQSYNETFSSNSRSFKVRRIFSYSRLEQNVLFGQSLKQDLKKQTIFNLKNLTSSESIKNENDFTKKSQSSGSKPTNSMKTAFSYILACNDLKPGDEVFNINNESTEKLPFGQSVKEFQSNFAEPVEQLYEKGGISLPLWLAPLGSPIHNIEFYPGEGGKLVRAAGTCAQIIQKPLKAGSIIQAQRQNSTVRVHAKDPFMCTIRLPSGQQQLLDLRCRATIGIVSNIDHNRRFLKKAGQRRWLGFRPVVRGVAMNPIDHPHGGGEGRTKGGRPSVSPWGKPAKGHCGNSTAKRRALGVRR